MNLTEILVVTSLILILSTMVLINYRTGQLQLALQRSANQVAQDIRKAKELAMSTKEFSGSIPEGGYGVHFKTSKPSEYKLYADLNGDEKYNSSDGQVKTAGFEKGVFLKDVSPNNLSINFRSPEPKIRLSQAGGLDVEFAIIVLALESDPDKTKTIKVNKLGLITIE